MFVQYTNGNYNVVINLDDGTKLTLSDRDQEWKGLKDTFKF